MFKKVPSKLYFHILTPLFEKVIHDQTKSFLDKNCIIYRYQKTGFRKFFSSESCIPYLNNKIDTDFESGLYTTKCFESYLPSK